MIETYRLLAPLVTRELLRARDAEQRGSFDAAWSSLERAHILSQPSARLHTLAHWAMLRLALRRSDGREIFGQIVRLAVAGVGSLLGRFPAGNTGRARVPIMRPMPIPPDVARELAGVGLSLEGISVWKSRRS